MIDEMVEVIDFKSFCVTFLKREDRKQGVIEMIGKSAEELGHGDIGFKVTVIDCGVDEDGLILF